MQNEYNARRIGFLSYVAISGVRALRLLQTGFRQFFASVPCVCACASICPAKAHMIRRECPSSLPSGVIKERVTGRRSRFLYPPIRVYI